MKMFTAGEQMPFAQASQTLSPVGVMIAPGTSLTQVRCSFDDDPVLDNRGIVSLGLDV